MKNLSLVSKMTISVTCLFLIWWLLNEYQTYRYTIKLETHEFVASHLVTNKLGLDIVEDFVYYTEKDLEHLQNVINLFPISTKKVTSATLQQYLYSLNELGQFTLVSGKNNYFSDQLSNLLKHEYRAILITLPDDSVQLLSKNKLSNTELNKISQLMTTTQNTPVSWFTFYRSAQTKPQTFILKKGNYKFKGIGLLVMLEPLISKLETQSEEHHQLFLAGNSHFISDPSRYLNTDEKHELLELLGINNNQQHVLRNDELLVVRNMITSPNWELISLISKNAIRQSSVQLLLKKLPSSIVLLLLISGGMLIIFKFVLRNPINTIVDIISDPQKPNLDKHLPETRTDELGQISSAYNKLLRELQESHAELELQVANRTKDLLEASQAAQAANERKTEHLTSISHEIRTPLNGILGALELLQTTTINQKQKGLIITAANCCQSLLSLVNNLLDFSRIEAGEIVLKSMSYQPITVIDEAMASIESQATSKGITLTTLVDSRVPDEMQLDPLRVRQILVNLLGNAMKFTEQGEIKVILRSLNQMLEYQIHDTGSGMSEQETITIFQPYVQGQHQKFGSGLGLPISKKLATMMDGNLTVSSIKNTGSCFTLSIPIIDAGNIIDLNGAEVAAPSELHQQLRLWGAKPMISDIPTVLDSAELQYMPYKLFQCTLECINNIPHFPQSIMPVLLPWKLKVLVVDDIDINRDIISKMLIELGQTVYTAQSAVAALELGKRNIFDLVLMDIRMPEVNGYEATKIWRNSDEMLDNSSPIIALTANAEPQEQATFEKAGMDYYVTKPVTLKELNHALEIAVDIQLERDVSLTINSDTDTPLLDIMETDLNKKLYSQLLEMLLGLKGAVEVYNWGVANHILHTIKGTCGLAGLQGIADTAANLELQLENENMLKLSDLSKLNEQLKAMEFESI